MITEDDCDAYACKMGERVCVGLHHKKVKFVEYFKDEIKLDFCVFLALR